jgi:aminopeptidase N
MVRGVELQTWAYHQDRDNGVATFELPARQALEFFSERIGPYSYEKLANVESAGLGGGTEHASVIFYGESSVTPRPATSLVYHEVAHQWFGNAITERDWDDVWLSEGFATYFTLLATEHYAGRDAFVAGLKRSRDQVFSLEKRLPGKAVLHDNLADMSQVLNQLIYQKGGWTLHMLRSLIGTETFWEGIRDYYARYRDGSASTDDFRQVMEAHAGVPLAWLFDQWLRRATHPVVEGSWSFDPGPRKLIVDLSQTQGGEPYRLPLELGIANDSTTPLRIEKFEMTSHTQRFEFSLDREPASVSLDPNTLSLIESRFAKR